jgi:hypothetical protein
MPYQGSCIQKWRKKNPAKVLATVKRWRQRHPETYRAGVRRRNVRYVRKVKMEIVAAYGGACSCCGEQRIEFLTIEHKNNDGAQHRRELKTKGFGVYLWLKRNNFPKEGFGILCWNCNSSRGTVGYCPHERERDGKLV